MRGGYFLAEESPEKLIQQFNAESLEDVFLKLSVIQNMGKRRRSSIAQTVTENIHVPTLPGAGAVNEGAVLDDELGGEISGEFGDNVSMNSRTGRVSIAPEPSADHPPELPPEEEPELSWKDHLKIVQMHHMHALIWKNFLWMWRNIPMMLFVIGLPVGQAILFCLAIGKDPNDVRISVVNNEIDYPSEHCRALLDCNNSRLSCTYLEYIRQNYSLDMKYYQTEEDARQSVVRGQSWAVMVVRHNFSDSLRNRLEYGKDVDEGDLFGSTISVYQDKSNENIATFLTRDLLFGFANFFSSYLSSCDVDTRIANLPIRWGAPAYGFENPNFTDFAAPGVVLTIIFFMAVALTSGAMLIERNEGILERSLVNGISGVELLSSQIFTQFIVMLGQTIMVLLVVFVFFALTQQGSWWLVFTITLLAGMCGMCFGFVVSCSCDTERTATYMALGSFLPIVMLCGIIWPIEAMDNYLKYISSVLPLTQATDSMRCVLARGWGMSKPVVYQGFVSLIVWIIVFLTISILVLKFKKG
ncbi:unnamed protein product [Acanthoscelides obtectus]|nr:unnamed protein product [Acanthoscelides obtectus]CAK1631329.1 ABC transporter G family member 20 [Acanthoscelides obtectus]